MHLGFVLKSILVKHFILFLSRVKPFLKAAIILQLLNDRLFCIRRLHSLVLNVDLVDFALFDKSLILLVANLSLFACFKLLPCFVFDHGCVGIQELALKFDFLELLGEAFFLFSLVCLFLVDVFVGFKYAFLTDSRFLGS